MNPGDLIRSRSADDQVILLFLGDEIPWNDTFGMIGPQHVLPRGSTGIILDRHEVVHDSLYGRTVDPRVFYKILAQDGTVGWLHENWLEVIG